MDKVKELRELTKQADELVVQLSDTAKMMMKCTMLLATYLHRLATFLAKGEDNE